MVDLLLNVGDFLVAQPRKEPPQEEGFYIFHGIRRVSERNIVSCQVPVMVAKSGRSWVVKLIGRHKEFPIENFNGVWTRLILQNEIIPVDIPPFKQARY